MAFAQYSILFAFLACAYAVPQYAIQPAPTVRYAVPPPPLLAPRYAYAPPAAYVVPRHHHHVVPVIAPNPVPALRAAAAVAPIVSQNFDSSPDGSYTFAYESGDGSQRQESGSPGAPAVNKQGRFAYDSPEGPVQVDYVADENGYQPSGTNVHPDIQKAVAAQVAQAKAEGPILPAPEAYHARDYPVVYRPPVVQVVHHARPVPVGYAAYPHYYRA